MKHASILLLCGTAMSLATNALAAPRPGLKEYLLPNKQTHTYPIDDLFFLTPGRVAPGPYAYNAYVGMPADDWWPPDTSIVPATHGNWGWSSTFIYSGFIYIPEGSNTVAFAFGFEGQRRVYINDALAFQGQWWDSWPCGATRSLDTGWHKIDILADNDNNTFKPRPWHPENIGFGIDWSGTGNTAIPENYVFPADTGDGALFIADPPPGYVKVKTVASENVTGDSADLSGYVMLGENHPGVMRVYYGPDDEEDIPGNWPFFADHPVPLDAFYHLVTIPLDGLTVNQEYHFRFAFTNDLGIFMAPNSLTFTPIDFYAPANFGWAGGITEWIWDDPAGWVNKDGLARQIPGGAIGDTLDFTDTPAGSRTVRLTNDVTIAGITAGFGGNQHALSLVPGDVSTPVTLHMQTLSGSTFNCNNTGIKEIFLGPNSSATRDLLVFNLHQSFAFNLNSPNEFIHYLNSPFTGGEPGGTLGFYHNQTASYSQHRVHVRNPNNTFIGDIIINVSNPAYRPMTVYFGDPTGGFATPGTFGDAANRVISQHPNNTVYFHASAGGLQFNRALAGLGTFRCVTVDGSFNWPLERPRPMTFGENGILEPGLNNTQGNLTLIASVVTFEPGSLLRVKVWPDGICDTLTLQLRDNPFAGTWNGTNPFDPEPGTLTPGGKIEFVEQERIPSGASWVIASTTYTNTILTAGAKFKSATPGYVITPERDPDGTLRVIATKVQGGAILLIK